jgi:hypothetical protein
VADQLPDIEAVFRMSLDARQALVDSFVRELHADAAAWATRLNRTRDSLAPASARHAQFG